MASKWLARPAHRKRRRRRRKNGAHAAHSPIKPSLPSQCPSLMGGHACALDRFGWGGGAVGGVWVALGNARRLSTAGRQPVTHLLSLAPRACFVVVVIREAAAAAVVVGTPQTHKPLCVAVDIRVSHGISVARWKAASVAVDRCPPSAACTRAAGHPSSTADEHTPQAGPHTHSLRIPNHDSNPYRGWCSRAHSKMGKVIRSKWRRGRVCVWVFVWGMGYGGGDERTEGEQRQVAAAAAGVPAGPGTRSNPPASIDGCWGSAGWHGW